ncbi:MAG: hypothetical protein SGJ10_01350 [Bacteroidota bacterium]|nr:hypothetical protein [Bacteroidota bacterium]
MKKLILLIIVMVSVTISSFAQEGAAVFENYKYRFQKYRLFNSSFGMGNNNVLNDYYIPQSSSSSNSASNFSLNGNMQFAQNINTQKLQQFTSVNGRITFSSFKSNSPFATYSNVNGGSFSFGAYQQNRFYRNNHFLELNYDISTGTYICNSRNNNLPKRISNINMNVGVNIGAGNGRLEMVGDVAQALFILKDFKARGIIINYTNEDATALAKEITRIYNTRIIDFRYRLRGQLGMLDSFFVASGLLNGGKTQSSYLISLFDNWLNNNYVQRFCGSRFSYGISYDNSYNNDYRYQAIPSNNYLSVSNKQNYYTPGLYFNYTKERPISLYWQESVSIDLQAGKYLWSNSITQIDTNSVKTLNNKSSNSNSRITAAYKLSWYPNSRTYLNAGVTAALYYTYSSPSNLNQNQLNLHLMPSANLFYFVSPKVNFHVGISQMLSANRWFSNKSTQVSTNVPSFNAGLNYYIY